MKEYSETVFFSIVDIECSGPVILHVNTFSGCYKSATKAIRIMRNVFVVFTRSTMFTKFLL